MAHGLFYLSDTNPNDLTGGGGCLCSPEAQADTKGPYVIAPSNDMDNQASPYPVVCATCLAAINQLFKNSELPTVELPEEDVIDLDDLKI